MKNREYLEKYLSDDKLDEGIELLDKGISPQYIVRNVDFYGNIINVDKRVLIPRFETELLVEKTIYYINNLFSIINSKAKTSKNKLLIFFFNDTATKKKKKKAM